MIQMEYRLSCDIWMRCSEPHDVDDIPQPVKSLRYDIVMSWSVDTERGAHWRCQRVRTTQIDILGPATPEPSPATVPPVQAYDLQGPLEGSLDPIDVAPAQACCRAHARRSKGERVGPEVDLWLVEVVGRLSGAMGRHGVGAQRSRRHGEGTEARTPQLPAGSMHGRLLAMRPPVHGPCAHQLRRVLSSSSSGTCFARASASRASTCGLRSTPQKEYCARAWGAAG